MGSRIVRLALFVVLLWSVGLIEAKEAAVDIGSRRELFVDGFLIDSLKGARLEMGHPRYAGVALKFDQPWEGPFSACVTVFKDGDRYRMYYRGLPAAIRDGSNNEVTCYAESQDGIRWTKPKLGLFEVKGTRENNVVMAGAAPCSHNFVPFVDTRPGVSGSQRYKAVGGLAPKGLFGFVSPDGIRWKKIRAQPLMTKGAFDSQNVVFWSAHEGCYVCYFRTWKGGFRWISRATSKDFLNWSEPVEMEFGEAPAEHLYTNQTCPYFRAPHIYVATAARFLPGRKVLTDEQAKAFGVDPRYYNDCSDTVLMTSRGGNRYERRFLESFVRPGPGLRNWVSRSNYPSHGIIPTGPGQMSVHIRKEYAQPTAHVARYTLRTDGFVSVHGPYAGGEMITKRLVFSGRQLFINYATGAAGSVRVEIQGADGKAIAGYGLGECDEVFGDEIERAVSWGGVSDVIALMGRPVRLRFVLKDADLYAIQFKGDLAEIEGPGPDVLYTFEGDAAKGPVVDRLAKDGKQNGEISGKIVPDGLAVTDKKPIFGKQSLSITGPVFLPLPNTQHLGKQVTFAAHVRDVPAGHRRLFSSYNGSSTAPKELIVDFDSDGEIGSSPGGQKYGIRFGYDGHLVGAVTAAVGNWSKNKGDTKVHHIAVTYDDGLVKIYFDGKQVGTGQAGKGALVSRLGDVQFNEDYRPASQVNEPFIGVIDDLMILRRVLSEKEVADVAAKGAAAVVAGPSGAWDFLYTMEGDRPGQLTDKLGDNTVDDLYTFMGTVIEGRRALVGSQSIWMRPSQQVGGLEIPGTRVLGRAFTLAAVVDVEKSPRGVYRLFAASSAGRPDRPGRLSLEFCASGGHAEAKEPMIRFATEVGMVAAKKLANFSKERHHIAATYDNGTMTIYLDGRSVAAGGKPDYSRPLTPLVRALHFGGGPAGAGQSFVGYADDVLILGRALSGEQVKTLAEKGAVGFR